MRLDQGQAGARIGVTPAMIEAGVGALLSWNDDYMSHEEAVERIIEAVLGERNVFWLSSESSGVPIECSR